MLINVPQYIDVEDKVAGPLTAKQLGWLIALGVLLFLTYSFLPRGVFVLLAIPMVLFFIALAFLRPYGQPLHQLLANGLTFLFMPKLYVWKRTEQPWSLSQAGSATQKTQTHAVADKKSITPGQLEGLAQILDTSGKNSNQQVEEILKDLPIKKA